MNEQVEDIAGSFIGWQCRLRQYAVRRGDGRPSEGMCPRVELGDASEAGKIVTVLVKRDPGHATSQFRYIAKKTNEPRERYEAAIRIMQDVYYQYPREFSDCLTASFALGTSVAARLVSAGSCRLEFSQANQQFTIPCKVHALGTDDPFYQATYWHNAMFNPRLHGPAQVLKFTPDWSEALATTT